MYIRPKTSSKHGFTLVELVVAMVIISVALVGVMSVINYTTLHSADPVLRQQAIAIAESYMEEITLKNYADPDDDALCPTKEGSRKLYDNVCDYNGLNDNTGARDQDDALINGLSGYHVTVSVSNPEITFGDPPVTGLKIDVTVTDPANQSFTLTGYRTNY
jgi:MSHA pilin protein MshD